jgi:N-acetyl-gamma-glutamyl-phosphate reductase
MIRVAILGATGYTALELIKLLLRHPDAQITTLTTRKDDRPHLAAVHPALAARLDLVLENLTPTEVAKRADCVFSCLPHGASAQATGELLSLDRRVIDFSADYRLQDAQIYARWYGQPHDDPGNLPQAVYGLPELYRSKIQAARLIANPGCYPTSAILPLAPLLKAGLVGRDDIVIDSKSGVSGAGRTPGEAYHFPECNESVSAYKIGNHRHTPEIDQVLSDAAGGAVSVHFTPHLIPMDRGILSTIYARPSGGTTEAQLNAVLREAYAKEPFVRLLDRPPATKNTAGTNYCDIHVRLVRDRVIITSAIDNLIKGASGAAVQNFNLLYDFPETTAL